MGRAPPSPRGSKPVRPHRRFSQKRFSDVHAAILPTLVFIEVWPDEVRVSNTGDFIVHVYTVEALGDPGGWTISLPRPRRVAPNTHMAVQLQPPILMNLRVDRFYRVVLRDDHYARWQATYDPTDREAGGLRGPSDPAGIRFRNPQLERIWPYPITWAIATWRGFVGAIPPPDPNH